MREKSFRDAFILDFYYIIMTISEKKRAPCFDALLPFIFRLQEQLHLHIFLQ